MRRPGLLLALAAWSSLAGVGAAWAQDARELRAAVFAHAAAAEIAVPAVALANAPPQRPEGVAKTSVEHAFERSGATGSLGFLCGLDERLDTKGGMGAFGSDPHGRFVGAKLHLSFR